MERFHRSAGRGIFMLLMCGTVLLGGTGLRDARASVSRFIQPGQSIGPARLGMSSPALVASLGPAVQLGPGWLSFPRWAIDAILDGGVAVSLSTINPSFRTAHGAGIGTRLDATPRLVGDLNSVVTGEGADVTVAFPFQGIGFAFRNARAVRVFVTEPIPVATGTGPRQTTAAPPGTPGPTTPPSGPIARAATGLSLTGLTQEVDASGSLHLAGQIVNAGPGPVDLVTVTVTYERFSGTQTNQEALLRQPIAPGAAAPFSLDTQVGGDVVVRYTVAVVGGSGPSTLPVIRQTQTVPPSTYAAFARNRVRVDVQLGAPAANTRGTFVQAFLSIGDTRPIPSAWVKDVRASVVYSGGSQEVHLTPGQATMILIPAFAPSGIPQLGQQPSTAALIGPAQVLEVVLGP